jgi:hypothetical protein
MFRKKEVEPIAPIMPEPAELNQQFINQEVMRDMQAPMGDAYGGVQPNYLQEDTLTKWELDTEKEIGSVKNTLRGKRIENGVEVTEGEPVLSDKGINSLMVSLKAQANKITSLTSISDDYIREDCKRFRKAMRMLVVYNKKEWQITNDKKGIIIQNMDTLMNAILSKGKEALMLKMLKQQVQVKELRTNNMGNMGGKGGGFPSV